MLSSCAMRLLGNWLSESGKGTGLSVAPARIELWKLFWVFLKVLALAITSRALNVSATFLTARGSGQWKARPVSAKSQLCSPPAQDLQTHVRPVRHICTHWWGQQALYIRWGSRGCPALACSHGVKSVAISDCRLSVAAAFFLERIPASRIDCLLLRSIQANSINQMYMLPAQS